MNFFYIIEEKRHVFVIDSKNISAGQSILVLEALEMVAEQIPLKAQLITDVAPTVGTHTGPGTVGLVYMAGYDYKDE